MATSDAQKRATIKYMKENLEEVRFRVKKGKREEIKKYALDNGYNGIQPYLKALIDKDSGIEL